MKLKYLIVISQLNESSRCGIHNSLLRFRPDLKDEMEKVEGLDVSASTEFLKNNGLWDETATKYLRSFHHWNHVYMDGPDKWSADKLKHALDRLMCHVAKLIRQSAVSTRR